MSPQPRSSSSQDQRDKSHVDRWLATPTSASVSQPADASLATASDTISTIHSPLRPASTIAPLDGPTGHTHFLHTPDGSSSAQKSSALTQPVLPSQHLCEPNIRVIPAQSDHGDSFPTVAEQRYQQQREHQCFQHGVSPLPGSATFLVDQRLSTAAAGFATGSGWEHQDVRVETTQGVAAEMPAQDLPPVTSGSSTDLRNATDFNPFDYSIADGRPRSSGSVVTDTILPSGSSQCRFHSPGLSSLVPVACPADPDEKHRSVSKTYSFVSLPGNAVKKRPS